MSPTGGAGMGGRMGREEGTMYSDSSSLSRASSAGPGLRTEEGLRTKPAQSGKFSLSVCCVLWFFISDVPDSQRIDGVR